MKTLIDELLLLRDIINRYVICDNEDNIPTEVSNRYNELYNYIIQNCEEVV